MSGHNQLAQTGVGGAIAIGAGGGTYYLSGGWMLAAAMFIVFLGVLAVRFGYRRRLAYNTISPVPARNTATSSEGTATRSRNAGKTQQHPGTSGR